MTKKLMSCQMRMHVLPILNVKFPNLFKFKFHNSVKTIKENKNCSLVGEESFFWLGHKIWLREGIRISERPPYCSNMSINMTQIFPSFYLE